jgi:hypothetical protein
VDRYSEVELKFDADPAMSLPDLTGEAGSVGEATESQLDATYFDTADARLARHHVTLRRRTGGDDAGWHLKLPAGQDERIEVRLPLGRATRTVPAAGLAPLPHARGSTPSRAWALPRPERLESRRPGGPSQSELLVGR